MKPNPLVLGAAYVIYVFLHLVVPLYSLVRWHLIPFLARHLLHFLVYGADGIDLRGVVKATRTLGKVPQHISFIFDERETRIGSPASMKQISTLVSWAIATGIPYISIFESNGVIKRHANELMSELERSPFFKGGLMRLSGPAPCQEGKEKQYTITEVDAPTSKEQEVDKFMLQADNCQHHRYLQKDGAEGRTFCVKLLSTDDARLDIINAIKTLSQNGTKPADINVDSFQKALAGFSDLPDPNLILKFDGTSVMPEFPPWQLALTEILEVGTLRDVTWPNFLQCLQWYTRSVQRFGK